MPVAKKDERSVLNSEFISIVDPSDIELCKNVNLKINEDESSLELPKKGTKALRWMFNCSKADTLIVGGPKSKRWTFYKLKENGSLAKIYKASAPKKLELSSLKNWLRKKLGYDGIVLARQGNFILAGLMSRAKNKNIQALLLKNSKGKLYIRGKKGAALLQLVNTIDGYGLFEVVINSDDVKDFDYSKVLFNTKNS